MKAEYRNSDPVIVKDDKTGSETREYQDNMEEILLAENESELLVDTLNKKRNEMNRHSFLKKHNIVYSKKIEKIKNFITKGLRVLAIVPILPMLTVTIGLMIALKGIDLDTVVRFIYALLSVATIVLIEVNLEIFLETCMRELKEYTLLKEEIPFLEEELERQQEKVEVLKKNKTKQMEPSNEYVSLKEKNLYQQELMEKKMALIELYFENKERKSSYENSLLLSDNLSKEDQKIKEVLVRLMTKNIETENAKK